MKLKTMTTLAAGVALAGAAFASDTGGTALVFKESGSFWHTATNSTMTVPVDFPDGATSATLTVKGSGYRRVYGGITAKEFTFSLPPAEDVSREDVYELTIAFDNGAEQTARMGLPYGLDAGAVGSARYVPADSQGRWAKAYGNVMIPVPAEATALSVGGSPVTADAVGFTGAQGWLALGRLDEGTSVTVALSADGQMVERTLVGAFMGGFHILIR